MKRFALITAIILSASTAQATGMYQCVFADKHVEFAYSSNDDTIVPNCKSDVSKKQKNGYLFNCLEPSGPDYYSVAHDFGYAAVVFFSPEKEATVMQESWCQKVTKFTK